MALRRLIVISFFCHMALGLFLFLAAKQNSLSLPTPNPDHAIEFVLAESKNEEPLRIARLSPDLKSPDQSPNPNAKFLSDRNRKTDKETQAKRLDLGFHRAIGIRDRQEPKRSERKTQKKLAEARQTDPTAMAMGESDVIDLSQGGELSQASHSSNDRLQGVEEGIETILNSKEFLFFAYYDRIKAQLQGHWEPAIRDRMRIEYRLGRVPASAEQKTAVRFILKADGSLESLDVLSSSGHRGLDDAALSSIKRSAPFPNPPKGMVDSNGRVVINWDFIIET